MTVRVGAGMTFRQRERPLAALLVAGGVLLAGCSGDGDESTSSPDAGRQQDSSTQGPDGDEVTVDPGPTGPPTEPAKIKIEPGQRSASGSTDITVEGDRAAFATPSGGIVCTVNERSAACQVLDLQFTPQAGHLVDDLIGPCTPEDADTVVLHDGRGVWTCLEDGLKRYATTSQGGWWIDQVDQGVHPPLAR